MDETEIAATRLCACENARRAGRALTQRYDTALAPSGLRAPQFALLAQLANAGPLTRTRLADLMAMDRTTLTRNLAPLERDGLLVTESGDDRRTRVVQLTAAGECALARALPLWRVAQERTVAAFGAGQFATLLANLATLRVVGKDAR